MAHGLRYYKEIAQHDDAVVRLEILMKGYEGEAIEIGDVVQGLSLQIQGQQSDVDAPIVKTSLSMTFIDVIDVENDKKNGFWEEFYTSDATAWKVVLKAKTAQETTFRTIWGGYITPDSFSETLDYRGSVNLIARDNIGHLQDFDFDEEGDEDGLIYLDDLLRAAWAKIERPMNLILDMQESINCESATVFRTLVNVSAFEGMTWYEAIEKILGSYGMVMRYVGDNYVMIGSLRYMPHFNYLDESYVPQIEPIFVAGAQRELAAAVKKIEEQAKYELEDSVSMPQVKESDFNGNSYTYRCKIDGVVIDGQSFGTLEHDAPVWAINNDNAKGWSNINASTLFFNPHEYDLGYFVQQRELGDEVLKYMYIAANNVDSRSVEFTHNITCADVAFRIKFGEPCSLDISNRLEQQSVFNLKKIIYSIRLEQNGITQYYNAAGSWVTGVQDLAIEYDATQKNFDFEKQVSFGEYTGGAKLTFIIKKIEYAQTSYTGNLAKTGLYACIQDFVIGLANGVSMLNKSITTTKYNDSNNIILKFDPDFAPAKNVVALPSFIKNGIFCRQGNTIVPAKKWGWNTNTDQELAVLKHQQLLMYYSKPNNLINATIVNADITRIQTIYVWREAEHILVSGTINFLTGQIEGAMLREFIRYNDLWKSDN